MPKMIEKMKFKHDSEPELIADMILKLNQIIAAVNRLIKGGYDGA